MGPGQLLWASETGTGPEPLGLCLTEYVTSFVSSLCSELIPSPLAVLFGCP